MSDLWRTLDHAHEHANRWLESLTDRGVHALATPEQMLAAFDEPLPEGPQDAIKVVDELATRAEPGLVATPSGRFFGFVIGGSLPAALAADWLTSAWDQNAGLAMVAPAEAAVEKVAAGWLLSVLGLPRTASVGFVTGGCMANFTCLAAARHRVLAEAGWDVEDQGLQGAPGITVVGSVERHATIDLALRYLGLGSGRVVGVAADQHGRISPDGLAAALNDIDGPVIVCLQAGNINTGACDDFERCIPLAKERGAWVHVDGAFGLWAAAAPSRRYLTAGVDGADSWATDAHKWLNVPYDCGLAIVADPAAHTGAMGVHASYLVHASGPVPDQIDTVPEFSRRGRGFPVWAALRSLGRQGVADMVERCCSHARRFADELGRIPSVQVLNGVVLNQVLVRFGDDDDLTREVVRRLLADGTAFMTGTTYRGQAAMRISVSNWSTTEADVDRSISAIHHVLPL